MNPSRKSLLLLLVVFSVLFSYAFWGFAAEFPTKPVTLIIPYPAGGSTDVTGRVLAAAVRKTLPAGGGGE